MRAGTEGGSVSGLRTCSSDSLRFLILPFDLAKLSSTHRVHSHLAAVDIVLCFFLYLHSSLSCRRSAGRVTSPRYVIASTPIYFAQVAQTDSMRKLSSQAKSTKAERETKEMLVCVHAIKKGEWLATNLVFLSNACTHAHATVGSGRLPQLTCSYTHMRSDTASLSGGIIKGEDVSHPRCALIDRDVFCAPVPRRRVCVSVRLTVASNKLLRLDNITELKRMPAAVDDDEVGRGHVCEGCHFVLCRGGCQAFYTLHARALRPDIAARLSVLWFSILSVALSLPGCPKTSVRR